MYIVCRYIYIYIYAHHSCQARCSKKYGATWDRYLKAAQKGVICLYITIINIYLKYNLLLERKKNDLLKLNY